MMSSKKLKRALESYLNEGVKIKNLNELYSKNAKLNYIYSCVKRLVFIYEKFQQDDSYKKDYLLALRDYLIVTDSTLNLKNTDIPEDNEFGIHQDEEYHYYAELELPDYVNGSFVKQAFLREEYKELESTQYNLFTDPAIYQLTKYKTFKSFEQKLAVYGAVNTPKGYTTLVSLPTGGGKSLITHTVAFQEDGLTIVIVPTVSLAIDQERTAKEKVKVEGIDGKVFAYYHGKDIRVIVEAIRNRMAKLIFTSPEALMNNAQFEQIVDEANRLRYLRNIIIDEAHIVVDWGDSFRVDYQCLESWRNRLVTTNTFIRTILLSATFEERSIRILKSMFSDEKHWIEIRCDSLRHEPRFIVVKNSSFSEKRRHALELIKALPHPMIVYVSSPADAEETAKMIKDQGLNNVELFTGKTKNDQREELIKRWINHEFCIMVATSAFGVGVDKPDVRTVLHLNIPNNPNAYYQELGRGGRDGLPCLSVMCVYPKKDLDISFGRINRRVLTTEKIVGRWDSMYNDSRSIRNNEFINIDTSIRPKYREDTHVDDSTISDIDMNWNIYVLLLLARNKMIKIIGITIAEQCYYFNIKIFDTILYQSQDRIFPVIDQIRNIEWDYYHSSFQLMRESILNRQKTCWSEMFFSTYEKAFEYCAGCWAHNRPIIDDLDVFPLKEPVNAPLKPLGGKNNAILHQGREILIKNDEDQITPLIDYLLDNDLSVIVVGKDTNFKPENYLRESACFKHVLILDKQDLVELMANSNSYYLSGLIAIIYSNSEREAYREYSSIRKQFVRDQTVRLIHIVKEDYYFSSIGKRISELIEGRFIKGSIIS